MPARIGPNLNANQERFAGLLAVGYSQADAYRECFKTKGRSDGAIGVAASKLANHPVIKARAQAIVGELNISSIDSANQAVIELIQDIRQCREDKKWSALAQFTRLRLQIHGILKENINITDEQRLTDEQLVQRIAKGDKSTERLLGSILKGDTFPKAV